MFEAAVLLSKERKLRTTGVAAALQSGGACTLFAEAAGAAGLDLPEFSPTTRRRLAKVLPHFASQNNPLDVTGQAAVETEMFEGALEALANDMGVGFIAFDAFPPRLEGETPWADPVLRRVAALRRETGVVFASVAMSPLAYEQAAKSFTRKHALPFLQGHHASAGAIRALVEFQSAKTRATVDDLPPHPDRAKALRVLRGHEGPIDEETGARILRLYGVARPKERTVASPEQAAAFARSIRFPVVVKAQAPRSRTRRSSAVSGSGCATRPTSGSPRPRCSRPRSGRGTRAEGARAADGAWLRGPRGRRRRRPVRADDHRATRRSPRRGRGGGLRAVSAHPCTGRAYMLDQASHCGLDPQDHDLRAAARAVEAIARIAHDLRGRLTSFEANPLLVGERGAVAVDALAEVRPG